VRLDVPLKPLLVIVGRELLTAHGAHLPVALHVLLKLALVVVGWKHHVAERALLVHVKASQGGGGKENRKQSFNLFVRAKSKVKAGCCCHRRRELSYEPQFQQTRYLSKCRTVHLHVFAKSARYGYSSFTEEFQNNLAF